MFSCASRQIEAVWLLSGYTRHGKNVQWFKTPFKCFGDVSGRWCGAAFFFLHHGWVAGHAFWLQMPCYVGPVARRLSASSDDTNESCLDVMQRGATKHWFATSYDKNVSRFHSHGWGRCPFLRSTFDSLLATARIPRICLQGFQTAGSLAAGVVTHLDLIAEMMISYCMSWLVDLMFCNMVCFKRKVVGCLMWFSFTVRFMVKRNSYSPFNGERTPTPEAVHHHQETMNA